MRILRRNVFLSLVDTGVVSYLVPVNINNLWGFGILGGVALALQIVTGLFLAFRFVASTNLAFDSVEQIMREVSSGALIRYVHMIGASMFFVVIYLHIIRGLYYGSGHKPREGVWIIGILIFILMIGAAFAGYSIVYSSMSYWALTVITNLLTVLPNGDEIARIVWGAYSVDEPTLRRFFAIHYLLPFIILALVVVHVTQLHTFGSNNPLCVSSKVDSVPFMPYFHVKDLLGILLMLGAIALFISIAPNSLNHPDCFVKANPLVTPESIVPEWYLLPFYAILRSIPSKIGGIVAMGGAFVFLALLPWISSGLLRKSVQPFLSLLWIFGLTYFVLGVVGQEHPESPFLELGRVATAYYFVFFPLCSLLSFFSFSLVRPR